MYVQVLQDGSPYLIIYPVSCIVSKASSAEDRLKHCQTSALPGLPGPRFGGLCSLVHIERCQELSPYCPPGLPSSASFTVRKLHSNHRR